MAEKKSAGHSKHEDVLMAKFQSKLSSKQDKNGTHKEAFKKAFTKWMNMKLARREDPSSEVKDLIEDIQDGVLMLELLEVLLGTTLQKEKGEREQMLKNTEHVLFLLRQNDVKLPEIRSLDIVDGEETLILSLLWGIILRFQIMAMMKEEVTQKSDKTPNPEKKAIQWCNEKLVSYRKLNILDLSLSWKNGLAFNALLHSYQPDMFEFKSRLNNMSYDDRLNHAFSLAKEKFGVPKLLETSDVNVAKPNKNLILMYVCTLCEYLEGSMVKKESAKETAIAHDAGETSSLMEREKAQLSEKLKELEEKLSHDEEHMHDEMHDNDNELDNSKKKRDKVQGALEDLEIWISQADDVLKDGRRMINEGYFDKDEEEEDFGKRMDNIDRRMKQLHQKTEHDRDQLSQTYALMLKQKLDPISRWVKQGKEKMENDKASSEYEEAKEQLEDYQKFQNELEDTSFITRTMEVNESDPNLSKEINDDLKSTNAQWKNVWDWFEEQENKLIAILEDWKKFREEELVLLNWFNEKEKMLNEVPRVDVADKKKVDQQLRQLEKTQKELEKEQDERLTKLENYKEKISEKAPKETTDKIKTKLKDLNDNWSEISRRAIESKHMLVESKKKMVEFQKDMDSVNKWIDGAEREMSEYNEDMSAKEKQKLHDRIQVKCKERVIPEKKVDNINRLGKDLSDALEGPVPEAIAEDVERLNERWQDVTAALESFSDKGYPDDSEREELHKKTFRKWMNAKLARKDPPCVVNDLIADIQDGKLLLDLLEVLTGTKLKKEKGDLRVHKLNNIEKAMTVLQQNNIKLTGISSFDIADGKTRSILGLMWTIILRFQVQDVMNEAATEESIRDFSIEKKILHWCQERLKTYGKSAKITDFSLSWKDGMAFNALLHSYRPELFDYESLSEQSPQDRLNHAFSVAKNDFDVPYLLEAADMDVDRPDKRLIIMYLCTLYDYLEGSMAKEAKIDPNERDNYATPGNDSWDALDSGRKISPSEHDKAVKELSEKLENLEEKISQAEEDKPDFNEKESLNSLENSKRVLSKHKKFMEDLEPLQSDTDDVINDGRRMIDEGYFDKGEVEQFRERMENIDKRMKQLSKKTENNRDKLSRAHARMSKKQMDHIAKWVKKGEKKMKKGRDSNEYEEVKKQLEDHQKFQDELGDISLVTLTLGVDGSDPEEFNEDAKKLAPQWKNVWDWSEDQSKELIEDLVDWTEFRDEELVMLNWLAQKENMLKEVLEVDVADEEKVDEQLERLEVTQKELEEQDLRLQKLQRCGEKLIGKVGENSPSAEEIRRQLDDFNDCWEQVAKRVLAGKERLITSKKKMKELQEDMDSVHNWIDGVERDIGEYKEDMEAEEQSKIKDKIEIKCEERPTTEQKVDRINIVGKEFCDTLDNTSKNGIKEDMDKLNERWKDATAALESFSDKGYPDANNNDCCLLRIMKRKLLS